MRKRKNIVKRTEHYKPKTSRLLQRSLKGYLRFFRGILWFAVAMGLVALTGFLIVYPLWFFSSGYKTIYSFFALGILFLALALALAGKLRNSCKDAGGFALWLRTRFSRTLKKIFRVFLALGLLYVLVFLYAHGYLIAAVAGTLVYLVFLGVALAGRRESL